jgi:hypothetical protein
MSKFFLFTFWGINAILFLSSSIGIEQHKYCTNEYCKEVNLCTITKKLDAKNVDVKSYELIKPVNFIIISSYNFEIPEYDVTIAPTGRAPPSILLI